MKTTIKSAFITSAMARGVLFSCRATYFKTCQTDDVREPSPTKIHLSSPHHHVMCCVIYAIVFFCVSWFFVGSKVCIYIGEGGDY